MSKDFNKVDPFNSSEVKTGWEDNRNKTIEEMIGELNIDKKLAETPMLIHRLEDIRDKDTGDFKGEIYTDGNKINIEFKRFLEDINKPGSKMETSYRT